MRKTGGKAGSSKSGGAAEKRFLDAIFRQSRAVSPQRTEPNRYSAAARTLRDALEVSDETLPGGSVESWNIAADTARRRFETEMPILVRWPGNELIAFYIAVILLRRSLAGTDAEAPTQYSTMWGHFLMGVAPRKKVVEAPLKGSDIPAGVATTALDKTEQILSIRLARRPLNDFCQTHSGLFSEVVKMAEMGAAKFLGSSDRSEDEWRELSLSMLQKHAAALPVQEFTARARTAVADLNDSALFNELREHLAERFGMNQRPDKCDPFARQLILQACLCPSETGISAVGFIPDVSQRVPGEDTDITSTALQVFLPKPLSVENPLWKMWAALVSIAGRGKSVHDFWDRAVRTGYQSGEFAIAHEMDTPLGILDEDRQSLSEDGKLAVDYLELWRRFAKRDWSEALPGGLDESFQSNDTFLAHAFRLGYKRAQKRGVVPNKRGESGITSIAADELLSEKATWLDADIQLPLDLLSAKKRWVYQVKSWIFFFAVGAVHHAIKYSFRNVPMTDDWRTSKDKVRSAFRITSSQEKNGQLHIVVEDAADDIEPEQMMRNEHLKPIRSNDLGVIDLPPVDGKEVTVVAFRKTGHDGQGRTVWHARIRVRDQREES